MRIGNAAHDQFQLDVYGEVLDAVYTYSELVDQFDHDSRSFLIDLGKAICRLWNQPDDGIWEIRSTAVHHTHSKVMAWVGLDRLLKLCRKYNWSKAPISIFEKTQKEIYLDIEHQGFNRSLDQYTREFNGSETDASLLILPLVKYCGANSSAMKSTREAIWRHLQKNNLVFRYKKVNDGLPGGEGAFLICTFWYIENLAIAGLIDEASDLLTETIKYSGPTGLLSEEIEPTTRELLGNYPQGFSHIGLINAAMAIDDHTKK